MANEELLAALGGLNVSPLQTPYGMGAQALAGALPSLYNPYSNVGTNIGVTLGGALIAGLLGYEARKQATEASLAANQYATQMLGKPAEERLALIQNLPEDLTARQQVQQGLLGLNTQLLAQQQGLDLLGGQEVAKQKALAQFYATPEGQSAFEQEIARTRAESEAKYAGLNRPASTGPQSLPSAVQQRMESALSFTESAQAHLDRIKKMSPAELKTLLTTGTSFFGLVGTPGFVSENESIIQQYRAANFGATLTKNEQRAADIITGKDLTASKADIEAAWQTLINQTRGRANRIIDIATQSPEKVRELYLGSATASPTTSLEESPAQKRNRELKERLANLEKLMGQAGK